MYKELAYFNLPKASTRQSSDASALKRPTKVDRSATLAEFTCQPVVRAI